MKMEGWYGYDLDGTLAQYNGWVDIHHIGEPIAAMVAEVKALLAHGKAVKIFTARVSDLDELINDDARRIIEQWCVKHIGQVLPVTCKKDFGMINLTDDRCTSIEKNTGKQLKVRKDGAGYVFKKQAKTRYQCSQCMLFIKNLGACELFSILDKVRQYGTCSYWVYGTPAIAAGGARGALTPLAAGYVERREGFSCGRCRYFNKEAQDCKIVDKDSPGDTPGKIVSGACCSNWAD